MSEVEMSTSMTVRNFWKEKGFWTMPISRWKKSFQAGGRAHFVASALAAPLMIAHRSGLDVNISFFAAHKHDMGVIYTTAKTADNRMVSAMA
jgi:NAD(P)-dependent dehydrogenase (short-subunit alcohol dehydrogenase family)